MYKTEYQHYCRGWYLAETHKDLADEGGGGAKPTHAPPHFRPK